MRQFSDAEDAKGYLIGLMKDEATRVSDPLSEADTTLLSASLKEADRLESLVTPEEEDCECHIEDRYAELLENARERGRLGADGLDSQQIEQAMEIVYKRDLYLARVISRVRSDLASRRPVRDKVVVIVLVLLTLYVIYLAIGRSNVSF